MNLPLFIAGRYLFAKKSHNVINIISAISAIGMAIGTASLIIILSVYNGFNDLIKSSLDGSDPDILVTPSEGKVFTPDENVMQWISDQDGVIFVDTYIQESVFVSYDDVQSVTKARGVSDPTLYFGDIPVCSVSNSLALQLNISPRFISKLDIYYPDRKKNISMINPMGSLNSIKLHPDYLFTESSEKETSLVRVPIDCMRELLGYENEVSAIEIRTDCSERQLHALIGGIEDKLGPTFKVADRFQQNESLFKMMRYEKAAIFLILFFIVIIIAFNIFGSLSMLIIEKSEDIKTFYSMGATKRFLRRTFILEGWLISLLGLSAGLIFGLLLSFIQQTTGIITIPGNYLIDAYPVRVSWTDIISTAAGVALIGYLIALLPVSRKGAIEE